MKFSSAFLFFILCKCEVNAKKKFDNRNCDLQTLVRPTLSYCIETKENRLDG